MIVEKDLYGLLIKELPGILTELNYIGDTCCAYKIAAFFSAYTKKQINNFNTTEAKKCFRIAEKFMEKGNYTVKNAIGNVFIFSVSNTASAIKYFTDEFPLLSREYRQQVNALAI